MARQRIHEDHALTGLEKKRRHDDQAVSIDRQLDEAMSLVDIDRKQKARKSLRDFIDTYMIGFVLEDKPSEMTYKAIEDLQNALIDNRPVQLQLHRGSGKTTLASIAVLYLLSYGIRKFCVIVSHDARSATNILKDIWRMVIEESNYSQDFPEMCKCFQLCDGSFRRRQLYRGKSTNIQKNACNILFPRLLDDKGNDIPTSGCAITVRGITSGIRGLKFPQPTGRPDCVLLDDLLDAKSAGNEEQNQKLLDIIRKDIFNLSSGKKLGVCMTSTPLMPDDLTDKIKKDVSWKTIMYPAIISWPKDIIEHPEDGLWYKYFQMYDDENINESGHSASLKFYRDNFKKMNEGAVTFQNRFRTSDGHLSGLQALLEKRHVIGNDAFQAEMQLAPVKFNFAIDIEPKDVLKNENDIPEGTLPEGFQFAVASSDLNLSFCITTTVVAFKADGTAHVMKHWFRKSNIGGRIADAEYNKSVYDLLVKHGKELKSLGIPIKGWAIDCNGVPFDSVTSFCNNSMQLVGLQACGFIGKASHIWSPNVHSKLRSEMDRTILCGDAKEQTKAGTGKHWVAWDSDYYREKVQNAFLSYVGCAGALSLYKGVSKSEHGKYAIQICAEKLKFKKKRTNGTYEYFWKSNEDHDALDSTAQAFACAAQFGMSSQNFVTRNPKMNANFHTRRRPKLKFI